MARSIGYYNVEFSLQTVRNESLGRYRATES